MVSIRAMIASEGRDVNALRAAATTLVELTFSPLRILPVAFAASLLETIAAACSLLHANQTCLQHSTDSPAEAPQEGECILTQSQPEATSKKPDSNGDAQTTCARCHLLAIAIEHLSSRHLLLARASNNLLKAAVVCFGSCRSALEALQQRAVFESKLQLPQQGLPLGIVASVKNSLADTYFLRAFRCIQAMLSAQRENIAEIEWHTVLEALHLSQLVLHTSCSPAHEQEASTGALASSLTKHAVTCASMTLWTSLVPPGHCFCPTQSLLRTAAALMKQVATYPVLWSGGQAISTQVGDSNSQAIPCDGQMMLKEAEGHAWQDNTHCKGTGVQSSSPYSRHQELSMGKDIRTNCTTPLPVQAWITSISSFMLRYIQSAVDEAALRASAMQCAAAALRGDSVSDVVGAQLVQAGADAVRLDLQCTSSETSELPDSADDSPSCGGHTVAAIEAFVSAAAAWIHAQPVDCLSCSPLRDAVDAMRRCVVVEALSVLACPCQQSAPHHPARAAMRQTYINSSAVSDSAAVLRSVPRFLAWCDDGDGLIDRHVRKAAHQCVESVQAALAQLPFGHVTTAVYVQAIVALLEMAEGIDKHGLCWRQPTVRTCPEGQIDKHDWPMWQWLAMICLRDLLTPSHMVTSLHVLSPILRRIMDMDRPEPCSSAVSQLLASRMALLDSLDLTYSQQVLSGENLRTLCVTNDRTPVDRGKADCSSDLEHNAVWAFSHVDVSKAARVPADSAACLHSEDDIEKCGQGAERGSDLAWGSCTGMFSQAERARVTGTVMMHVKEVLAIYHANDAAVGCNCK